MYDSIDKIFVYPWWAFVWGFSFSIIIGGTFIKFIMDGMRILLTKRVKANYVQPFIIGLLELTLYPVAWIAGKPEFIIVWLTFKTAGGYHTWREKNGRIYFNNFLVGNALCVLYGTIGASVPIFIKNYAYNILIIIQSIIVIGSILLILYIRRYGEIIEVDESEKTLPKKDEQPK